MEIVIHCASLLRLSRLAATVAADDPKPYLQAVWLETKGGHMAAVVTNRKLAAVEYLGEDAGPDAGFAVPLDPAFMAQVETEAGFGSRVRLTQDGMKIHAMTDFAYYQELQALATLDSADNHFNAWRNWFPDALPVETHGAMFQTLGNLATLNSAAPSGSVIFPEFIDTRKPVVVRDLHDENWLGVFLADPNGETLPRVTLPEWVRA